MPPAETCISSTFSLSHLPPELRIKIWSDALPPRDPGAIFFYRKRCWMPEWLEESDPGYLAGLDNISFGFRINLLERVEVKAHLSLASVNREARGVAVAWAYKQGTDGDAQENPEQHTITRPFQPTQDILFIKSWQESFVDAADRGFEPDLLHRTVSVHPAYARIAIPEAELFGDWEGIGDLFSERWFWPDVVYVIIDTLSSAQMVLDSTGVQTRWRILDRGYPFIWSSQHGRFDMVESEDGEHEALFRRVGEVLDKLHETLVREDVPRLEIRLATVERL